MLDTPLPPLFDALLARARRLYSLPAVAMEVLQLTASDQVDLAALRGTIEHDPALVVRLLRAVNSPLFRVGQPVANLAQALTMLGIQPLKLLVLSFSLPRNLCGGEGESLGAYWRRTLAKAVAARHIAANWLSAPPEEAFLAGLLQDLGVLVLLKELGRPYARLLSGLLGQSRRLAAAEETLFGFSHTMLSARLLSQWGLPDLLVRSVAMPLACDTIVSLKPPVRPLAMTLHLADLAAELVVAPRAETVGELCVVGRKYVGLKREQIEPLLARLRHELPSLAEMLRVEGTGEECYDRLLADAHEQLAAMQDDVLPHLPHGEAAEQHLLEETAELTQAVQRLTRSRVPAEDEPPRGSPRANSPATPDSDAIARTVERLDRVASTATAGVPSAATATLDPAAATDSPLTARLALRLAACRARRQSCSLLVVEPDLAAGDEITLEQATAAALAAVDRIFHGAGGRSGAVVPLDAQLALILPGQERPAALELARGWQQEFAAQTEARLAVRIGLRIGAATVRVVSPNFPPGNLIAAALRCLHAAGRSGGADIKSIEL